MSERTYDDSLRTDFFVIAHEDRPSTWSLRRLDDVNWNIGAVYAHGSVNGSGKEHGPSILVSDEQAEAYIKHVAELWNADVRRRLGEPT